MRLHMIARTGHPTFLDLPWDEPLADWRVPRLVEISRGISRHVVRFVDYDGALYALKELPERLAQREYRLLRHLEEAEMPVVQVVGMISDRSSELQGSDRSPELPSVLITRHLEFSLPYRNLFTGRGVRNLRNHLLDALVQLLVRLHLVGFFWGDCSLSNTLFRRDAGALAAYLVDAETGELHPELTPGQRQHDLMIAEENIAGDLLDVNARYGLPDDLDPFETAAEIPRRYDDLWTEVRREEVLSHDDAHRIDQRLQRLNELGFDVEELELVGDPDRYRLRLSLKVVEPGHHRRRLHSLTGMDVQENQARRLLNDLARFTAELERREGRPFAESVAAYRWLSDVFEPAIEAVPSHLRGKLEPAEIFHELLEHRWFLSEREGRDVGMDAAITSYLENILAAAAPERSMLLADTGELPPVER